MIAFASDSSPKKQFLEPDMSKVFASTRKFADMLDETERLVERAIDAMQEGIVHPDPINSDVCRYCPVAVCSKRGA